MAFNSGGWIGRERTIDLESKNKCHMYQVNSDYL